MGVEKGLYLYLSNSLDKLSGYFLDNFKASYLQSSFFDKKTVIIQTTGIAKWLSYKICDNFGVCANVDFVFPKGFIVQTLKNIGLVQEDDMDFYDKPNIITNILKSLNNKEYNELNEYTNDKNGRRLGQFVSYLADLFDQYLTYRPEFLKNADRIALQWQRSLFVNILNNKHTAVSQAIEKFINQKEVIDLDTDKTVELFAISLLPPVYTYFFRKLSDYVRVNLYVLNPSREFWFDEPTEFSKLKALKKAENNQEKLYFTNSNPILINNAKLTGDFLSLLYETEGLPQPIEIEDYTEYNETTCLNRLKNKILNNDENAFQCGDSTIQIHSYQTKLREVEGVYNYILSILDDNKDISLEDIVVMCPKIDEYSSFIDGIFKNKNIKYTISDNKMPDEDDGLKALFYIVENLSERFNVNQLLELIELEAVRKKFQLSNSDTELIKRWLKESNLRWGLTKEYIKNSFKDMNVFNSVEYAFERLLYGYLSAKKEVINDVLAYDDLSIGNSNLLGKVLYIVDKITGLSDAIKQKAAISKHIETMKDIIDTFIDLQYQQSVPFVTLNNQMQKYEQSCEEIPFLTFYEILKSSVNKSKKEFNFLRGGVTFCELVPLRSIPFKAVCLMGMNSEEFPRNTPKVSFNEIEQNPKKGDRSSRLNDRLLFLETLLSAEKYLYISYIGKDIKRNNPLNPSIAVSELIEFLNIETLKHPLHSFSSKYFDKNSPICSYSKEDYELAKILLEKSYSENLQKSDPMSIEKQIEETNGSDIATPDELIVFLRHPVQFFFKKNGINFNLKDDTPKETENTVLDGLDRYSLIKKAFKEKGVNKTIEYSGALPHGSLGELAKDDILNELHNIENNLKTIDEQLSIEDLDKRQVRMNIDSLTIEGNISFTYKNNIISVEYTHKSKKEIHFAHILKPVIYSAMLQFSLNEIKEAYFVNTKECLHLRKVRDSKNFLQFIASLYQEGVNKPIVLFDPKKFDETVPLEDAVKKLINNFMPKDDDLYNEYILENFEFTNEYRDFIKEINIKLKEFYAGITNGI